MPALSVLFFFIIEHSVLMVSVGYYKRYVRKGFNAKNSAIHNIFYVSTKGTKLKTLCMFSKSKNCI